MKPLSKHLSKPVKIPFWQAFGLSLGLSLLMTFVTVKALPLLKNLKNLDTLKDSKKCSLKPGFCKKH